MKKKRNYLWVTLKGIAMGAADVVPGVSGGTIAFITGIYEELLDSIKSIDIEAIKLLFRFKWKALWKKINGNFLVALVCGIGISIFSLAKLMTYLLHNHPIAIWSFFFGLIIASCFMVGKEIKKWNIVAVIALIAGGVVAYTVTVASPTTTPDTWWFIMLSGAIAICAMILPGISGAFILLLMGQYETLMKAVSELNIGVIAVFAVGAVIGIICFSHFLSWLLKNYHNMTVALLTGFMAGSLNKIWPWKNEMEVFSNSRGAMLVEQNVLPDNFNGAPQIILAVVMCLVGFFLIWGIEKAGAKKVKN
ncbi:DUF368 domain-containing protein [Odoribacter sp. OttesenSCG-928-G04]|nr:DUF368 domain-containing protein [Odoribacter sp. OttesenSCG-928-G04]MDL2331279.1 DUF368 domain-containing protein [Odoribacter sp. OttesenSCG-928-A06]